MVAQRLYELDVVSMCLTRCLLKNPTNFQQHEEMQAKFTQYNREFATVAQNHD